MTTTECAAYLDISDARVRQLIGEGRLPAEKFGWGVWMIRKEDAEAFKAHKRKAGRPRKDGEQ